MDNVNSNSKIDTLIKQNNAEFIENELRPFLRIPSSTLNKDGIHKAKEFILSYLSDFAEDIKEYQGEINPLITAKVPGKKTNTILIYMMYDTQPIDKGEKWICNPFGAEIRIVPPPLDVLGKCIIARGAYNSKTPLICFLNVIKVLKKNRELPLSLILMFDGEEEIGSPTLQKFLDINSVLFKPCIDVYYPATKQDIEGVSILKLGYKGILSLTFKAYTKNNETHSAFSAMIPNPANDLISLLNTIYSDNKFLIKSLRTPYNLTEGDNLLLNDLMKKLDIESIKKKAGIVETVDDTLRDTFVSYLFKPTFNISTLKSGYLDNGTKNMVANHALCNIDIRFPHDVNVDEIFSEIKEKVEIFSKKSKCSIELIKNVGYEGSRVSKDSILVKSLIKTAKILNFNSEIWPLSAAAAPLSMIQKILGLNFIAGGLGIGGYAHSPNEFIQYDSIINSRLSYFYFLKNYGELVTK